MSPMSPMPCARAAGARANPVMLLMPTGSAAEPVPSCSSQNRMSISRYNRRRRDEVLASLLAGRCAGRASADLTEAARRSRCGFGRWRPSFGARQLRAQKVSIAPMGFGGLVRTAIFLVFDTNNRPAKGHRCV
jgi:hypothetical protein